MANGINETSFLCPEFRDFCPFSLKSENQRVYVMDKYLCKLKKKDKELLCEIVIVTNSAYLLS